MKYVLLLICGLLMYTGGQAKTDTLKTVDSVNLLKYAGKWYEIASKPIHWQRNCDCTSAEYTPRSDGKIDVLNSCNDRKKLKRDSTRAVAWPTDATNAKLKVKFGLITGDYQIIALAPDYSYAMVGTGDRKYLWILSRTRIMDEAIIKDLVATAEKLGFVVEDLQFTKQSCYNNY
ncbi:MAG: lipocalin family protein [Chitinophagales bacterium]